MFKNLVITSVIAAATLSIAAQAQAGSFAHHDRGYGKGYVDYEQPHHYRKRGIFPFYREKKLRHYPGHYNSRCTYGGSIYREPTFRELLRDCHGR